MKSAKKILLLVLSLMLLIGIFAIAAFADDSTTATVVYPDGSTDTVAVDGTIVPKEFTTAEDGARLYYGAGNTLFKDDATEGWTFTVEGESEALADLTVTADMAGKRIIASGADKVYFTTKEELSTGTTMVYHLTDDLSQYFTSANKGDEGDGAHTGAASYASLCTKDVLNKLTLTVYSDSDCDDFRPCFTNAVSKRPVLFDLNGHTLRYQTSNKDSAGIDGTNLYLYSSKPNAHLYVASGILITVDDVSTVYLGEDDSDATDYADNIHFHCRAVLGQNYGSGAYIYGGHYHQLPGGTNNGFVNLNRRVYAVNNASFYVLDGYSVFHDLTSDTNFGNVATGTAINNCKFYSQDDVGITHGVNGINTKFANCTFYGLTAANAGTEGKGTVTANEADGNVFEDAVTYGTVTWHDGTTSTYYAENLEDAKTFLARQPQALLPYNVERDGGLYRYFAPVKEFAFDGFNAVATEVGEATKIAWTYYINGAASKVYYKTDGATLNTFLAAMEYNAKIKLWEDIEANTSFIGNRKSMETNAGGAYLAVNSSDWLDLNGYTLTMTTTAGRIESQAPNFYVYSSRPGAILSVPNASNAFYTNNGDYKIIDGKVYGNQSAEYKASALKEVKPTGSFFFGEETAPTETVAGPYGKNLTVICKSMTGNLYGNTVHFYGGTFVQAEKSTAQIFLDYTYRDVRYWHTTFVTTNPATVHLNFANNRANNHSFKDCTFIYAGDGAVELGLPLAVTTSGSSATDAHPKYQYYFTNCNFYNIIPMASYEYDYTYKYVVDGVTQDTFTGTETLVVNYNGTTQYGFSGLMPTLDLDPGDGTRYLAHGSSSATITANGDTYVLDGAIVTDLSTVLVLTHENAGTEYWMVGASTPLREAGNSVKIEDGMMYTDAYYDYTSVAAIDEATGEILSPGIVTVALAFNNIEQAAFTYRDLETNALYGVGYEACGSTAEGVFEKFYELFNAPDAGYEIIMYADMTVNKGMGFGAVVLDRTTDTHNRDYFASLANGSIIWDLNGTTVTIAQNVTGCVKTAAANCSLTASGAGPTYGGSVVFGFEGYNTTNSFTLKSSKADGKIVNLSAKDVFAVGEGKKTQLIIQGENLTVDAGEGLVIASHELEYSCNDLTDRHQILGGTFISSNAIGVIKISMNTTIENAILISKNPSALGVVYMDSYRSGRVQANNVTFIAESDAVPMISMGTSGSGKYTLAIADCTIAGASPAVVTSRITAVTYSGTNTAANPADLAIVNPSAPAGAVAAYTSISANGEYYKTCTYFDANYGFVTVNNEVAASTELWAVGATFVASGDVSSLQVVEIDGVWHYRANPVWTGMIDGEAVADILAAENAGKTVTLTVGGDTAPLYFTRKVGDSVTYYYGDAAAANTALVALIKAMGTTNSTITFYSNFELTAGSTITTGLGGKSHTIDLNGYTLTMNVTGDYPIKYAGGTLIIYSSREGGVIDASKTKSFWMTDSSGSIYLGEPSSSSTAYGKNFTLICNAMNTGRLWSTNGYILGGTYIQPEGASSTFFLSQGNSNGNILIRNATFILNDITTAWMQGGCEHNGVIENVTIIAKNQTALFAAMSGYNKDITFQNCKFYNITPTLIDGATYTYEDCYFNKLYDAQANGIFACTDKVVLTVNGTEYVFNTTVADAEQVETVNWGFGITEPWVIGATATHDGAIIDQLFAYTFNTFTVGEGAPAATLSAVKPGALQMSLTLQSNIRLNLTVSDMLNGATVKIDEADAVAIAGAIKLQYAVAPNVANLDVPVVITIGDNTHTLNVNIGDYAKAIVANETYADAHNLVYAMIDYVRVMTGDDTFCDDVELTYVKKTLTADDSENEGTLLESIAFQLDATIAIAVKGEAAVGKEVVLTLETGRIERATVDEDGTVIFQGLYVNEFNGEMTIEIEGETYYYSLANYLHGLTKDSDKAAVQALYNYAFYAQEYVDTLPKNNA